MSQRWSRTNLLARAKHVATSRLALVVIGIVLASAGSVFAGTRLQDARSDRDGAGEVQADGSLKVDPAPLTLDDVAKSREGSASRTVMRLWYFAQWGSPANVLDAYKPEVIRRLGIQNVASAYSSMRASLVAARPRIVSEVKARSGTVVTMRALRRNAEPTRHSFTLERGPGGRWQIVFDTLLEDALAAAVQAASSPDPNSKPPASAVRKGLIAAREFRAADLESKYARRSQRQVRQPAPVQQPPAAAGP